MRGRRWLNRSLERIGDVTLNYRFYKGSDQYSDGDVEENCWNRHGASTYEEY